MNKYLSLLSVFFIIALISACDSNNTNSDTPAFVKVCEADSQAELCDQRYALCIAASCDPETIDGSKIECGECESEDGSCGYCYVFEGLSCSFNAPCNEIEPIGNTVFSTYSEELSTNFGFKAQQCNEIQPQQANCMDAPCTLTGETVPVVDIFGETIMVPTAICDCEIINSDQPSGTLGGQCNQANCSSVWSTSTEIRGSLLEQVAQCTE